MNNPKSRASLMVIAAVYLMYIAYELFQGRSNPDSTMSPVMAILFCVLFVLFGIGLLFYALRVWKTPPKEEEPKDSEDSMK